MAAHSSIEVCPICVIIVGDSKSLQCDGNCDRWFHKECMKMSSTEYAAYANDRNKKWFCNRDDCVKSEDTPVGIMSSKLDAILSKLSKLATKDEIANISASIDMLSSEVRIVTDKLIEIEPRLLAAEKSIAAVVNDVSLLKQGANVGSAVTEDIIHEINDRSSRARNIVLHNIPESRHADPHMKKDHDLDNLKSIFGSIQFHTESFTFFRLGKSAGKKPRPIKVIFKSQSEVISFFKSFSQVKIRDALPDLPDVTASRDRTTKEREHLGALRSSLAERTGNGEENLTIKYLNGIPKIITKKLEKN